MKEDLNMWITAPGWINEHLQFMGNFEVCLYRVEATRALIIGGGMMHVVPELDRQISAADKPDPSGLVIQHSHADHCGAVSYLRWRYPGMEVLASPYACDLFSREKVMRHIELANRNAVRVSGEAFHCAEMGIECTPFTVDRAVCEGDVIELGEGLEAHIMEVPGHTRCSIAVYIPAWKMLFPSDALPVPVIYEGSIHFKPSPQYSYSSYMQSLRRLEKLNFDVMALEPGDGRQKWSQDNRLRPTPERQDAQPPSDQHWDRLVPPRGGSPGGGVTGQAQQGEHHDSAAPGAPAARRSKARPRGRSRSSRPAGAAYR